jgi:hypothetical protein
VGDDEDGFITLLDLQTGDFPTDVVRSTIRKGSAEDDVVTVCDDPNDGKDVGAAAHRYVTVCDDPNDGKDVGAAAHRCSTNSCRQQG